MVPKCKSCQEVSPLDFQFSMAFQPIVDVRTGEIFAHEALVRGPAGEGASTVLSRVDATNRYTFDQQCRVKAIEMAARLFPPGKESRLSINFMPNAVYEPRACIRTTLDAAMRTGFPARQIIFEFTENEQLDVVRLLEILRAYRQMGFMTALDDFGAGHAGLGILADFQPDIVKVDMNLIRNIDTDPVRRSIVRHLVRLLDELGITTLCEGIETAGELEVLMDLGVRLVQGYHLARPCFEGIASTSFTPREALMMA